MQATVSPTVGRALALLPQVLTATRLASAPLMVWLIAGGNLVAAAALCAAAMFTDLVDGPLVRRYGRPSRGGAFFDVWADFLVIIGAFGGLGIAGIIPLWPLLPIGLSFALFIVTSRRTPKIYDPIGRYLGGILMTASLILLMVEDLVVQETVLLTASAACLITMAARVAYVLPGERGRH